MLWKTLLGMALCAGSLLAVPIVGSADFSYNLATTFDGFHNDALTAVNELNYSQSDYLGTRQIAKASLSGNLLSGTLAVTQGFGAPVPHPPSSQTAAQLIASVALPAGYHNVVLSGNETVQDDDISTSTQFLNSILLNGVPTAFPITGNLGYPSQTATLLIPNLDAAPLTFGFEFDVAVNQAHAGDRIDFYFTFNGEPAASVVPEPATWGMLGIAALTLPFFHRRRARSQ
ncbi:MAG TPA: PEP-CTERM sorting domain-containing protein [Bryobacteraceae bacterium]